LLSGRNNGLVPRRAAGAGALMALNSGEIGGPSAPPDLLSGSETRVPALGGAAGW